ncbi:NAD(P)-binding protein [Lindgomyces ingoldianus]|uniref:NAD(P)-binding protein n=1 Tax=Lindgomyces ingoldianus TaxID=673940 RepID=A0ACB6Q8G6_9PLEO|nr:NAD(P)-binding protein [Lindgomyces ingoldianus]KAF2462820.1 NAD(P)-binding protein [Lindgomyces ingoldianus]
MSTESLIRVTVCVNRKPGTTEDEFSKYWAYKHGPLATEWLQPTGRSPLAFDGMGDFWVKKYEDFEAAFLDPYYLEVIQPDEKNLIDMESIQVTIGVERVVIEAFDMSIDIPLKDKIILITGGASGIGLALTQQSHALGARVLVADLRPTPLFTAFAASKPNILFIQSDVSKWSSFDKIFAACEEKWNDVPDAYGICAGLFEPPFSNFWDDREEGDGEKGYMQVRVNVDHPVKLTRMAMRKSLERGKRASVCIIHAIIGFVKSLSSTEPLTGVKITTICPGAVNTPLFTPSKISQFSFAEAKALTPDDVAKHMLELLQKKEYPCGTMLELSLTGTRVLPEWNIAPPAGEGTGQELNAEEMMRAMLRPIEEKLGSERGAKL